MNCCRHILQSVIDPIQRQFIRFFIIYNQIIPKGYTGNIFSILLTSGNFNRAQSCCIFNSVDNGADNRIIVTVFPADHLYSWVFHIIMFLHPQTESRQSGRNGRYLKRQTLQRRISPRFIIRGENGQIHPYQEVIVRHIEYTIVSVQIRRDKEHFHTVLIAVA